MHMQRGSLEFASRHAHDETEFKYIHLSYRTLREGGGGGSYTLHDP